jgi:hypothetical protein
MRRRIHAWGEVEYSDLGATDNIDQKPHTVGQCTALQPVYHHRTADLALLAVH